jgi:poly-gamma-glutamate capsule biosynthesis protein CapA/YwtB (metallophosphatase superfamily)
MMKVYRHLIFSLLVFYFSNSSCLKAQHLPLQLLEHRDSITTVNISVVGDLMCHSVQFNYARVDADSFDFSGVFKEVNKYLSSSDFTYGNLETVLAGKSKSYSGYPFFNTPDAFLDAIKNTGFDLLVTANNHALDQGEKGILRTIKKMNEIGINHTGTFISQRDRDSVRIVNLKNIKLAVLAYTYGTNDIPVPKGKNYLINMIDFDLIESDIAKARKDGAEIVLVNFHYGEEYKREPVTFQNEVVNKTIEAGADIIIGGHPHVIQPVDYFKTDSAKLDTGFVAYSMGNFISNQRWRYSDAGLILNIQLVKNRNTDSIYIKNVSYVPTWVFKGSTENKKEYIILPSTLSSEDSVMNFLTKTDQQNMQRAFNDTKYILTKYNSNIEEIMSPKEIPVSQLQNKKDAISSSSVNSK